VSLSISEIKQYWEKSAEAALDTDGLRPAARDPYLQDVVESRIEKWLRSGDKVLDVGCGDGGSTVRFARRVKEILGVDYIDKFVDRAKCAANNARLSNSKFETADVLNLLQVIQTYGKFDIAVSIRCLINLNSWEKQAAAIEQIAGTVKSGGLYLTSEGWAEGFDQLNLLRSRVGLPEMSVVKYNLLMRRGDFEREVSKYFDILDYESAGLFLFLSRVVQPLFVAPDAPSHQHRLNDIGAQLEKNTLLGQQMNSCDYAGVYILRRK
jgi:SAM-dependent methyltransferase